MPCLVGFHINARQEKAGKSCWNVVKGGTLLKTPPQSTFADLANNADRQRFNSIMSDQGHVLIGGSCSPNLGPQPTGYNLQPREHGFELHTKNTCNFIAGVVLEFVRHDKPSGPAHDPC